MSMNYKKLELKSMTYIDKEANKHKHDYCIKCLLEITNKNIHATCNYYNKKEYHYVYKCNLCNSFIPDIKDGNYDGTIFANEKIDKSLPTIYANTNYKGPQYEFYKLYDVKYFDKKTII